MSTIRSENCAPRVVASVTLLAALFGCSAQAPLGPTAEARIYALSTVRGRVLDLNGTPLDSFRVVATIPDSTGVYLVVSVITSSAGTYSLRPGRTTPGLGDSALVAVTAQSVKGGDRLADGMYPTAQEKVWLPFVTDFDVATYRARDIIVPFRRR